MRLQSFLLGGKEAEVEAREQYRREVGAPFLVLASPSCQRKEREKRDREALRRTREQGRCGAGVASSPQMQAGSLPLPELGDSPRKERSPGSSKRFATRSFSLQWTASRDVEHASGEKATGLGRGLLCLSSGEEEVVVVNESLMRGLDAYRLPCTHLYHKPCILRWMTEVSPAPSRPSLPALSEQVLSSVPNRAAANGFAGRGCFCSDMLAAALSEEEREKVSGGRGSDASHRLADCLGRHSPGSACG
eukprot:768385-Hanusia_phi.AAC.8